MINTLIEFSYLLATALFVFGLKKMSKVATARWGNLLAMAGMFLAIAGTLFHHSIEYYGWIFLSVGIGTAIGALLAWLVQMTAMPQMVALLNGFGGLASALVASAEFLKSDGSALSLIPISLGAFVGTLTFTGSVVAFAKLQGWVAQRPIVYSFQNSLNLLLCFGILMAGILLVLFPSPLFYWLLFAGAFVLGILLVLPIGGADMPVVISLLNSYSGVAAAITGFVLSNNILIVAGALVGAAGLILTQIMCHAMNRSLANVAFGSFGKTNNTTQQKETGDYTHVKSCTAEEAALILESARSVIIVPGYGLAVSRAQHAVKKLTALLESRNASVKYAIHPVAGRMPGHMNILLAEAEVPYNQLYEMDVINSEFPQTDVVLVIGANDVVNPAAKEEPGSPIYGMPILNVDQAKSVIVIKRTLSPGFAGIKNPLFEKENTLLYYADAKKAVEDLISELEQL